MTDWVRLWHDMPTDPKWRTIARKSGQRVGDVIAVFNFLMVNASSNSDARGSIAGFDCEDVATALDLDENEVQAILSAMQGKVLDGDRLTGWEKRQPKREDGTASERKAAWKEREQAKRNALERIGTQGNAPETETETETDYSVSKETAPVSDKEFWDGATSYLGGNGKRALIGKWCRDYGKPETAQAITAAQLERAVEPVAFIERTLRNGKARASPAMTSPC